LHADVAILELRTRRRLAHHRRPERSRPADDPAVTSDAKGVRGSRVHKISTGISGWMKSTRWLPVMARQATALCRAACLSALLALFICVTAESGLRAAPSGLC
jgi:hypothetical protein